MEILEFHNLHGLMGRRKDLHSELIKEFYATVYFHPDEANTMTWMSATKKCSATLAEFVALLELPAVDPNDSRYFRIHAANERTLLAKPYLLHCYDKESDGRRYAPNVTKMSVKYYVLHRVLRHTIHVKIGERAIARGWMINLLSQSERQKNLGVKLDVMHYMFNMMRLCVLQKKVPIYAPYLQLLIESRIGTTLATPYALTEHKPLQMNFHGDADSPPPKRSRASPPAEGTSSAHPLGASKTTWKSVFKKMNCFGIDVQHRAYEAHRNNKIIRSNQKKMARHMNMEFASGSEDDLTPEEEWVSTNSNWFMPPSNVDPNVNPSGESSNANQMINTQFLYADDDLPEFPDLSTETVPDWFGMSAYQWPAPPPK